MIEKTLPPNMLSFTFERAHKKWDAVIEVYDHDRLTQAVESHMPDISRDSAAIVDMLLVNPKGIVSKIWFIKDCDPSNGPHGEPVFMAFNRAGQMTAAKIIEGAEVKDLDAAELALQTQKIKQLNKI